MAKKAPQKNQSKTSSKELIALVVLVIIVAIVFFFIGHSAKASSTKLYPQNVSVRLITDKSVTVYSILYPAYTLSGYNASYVSYFSPTATDIYYDVNNNSYFPLPNINATQHGYDFNFTANRIGYLTLNYTSTSNIGVYAADTDCYLNLNVYYQGTASQDTFSNTEQNGKLILPVHIGKNCFVIISNSNAYSTVITFNATFTYYGFPSDVAVIH